METGNVKNLISGFQSMSAPETVDKANTMGAKRTPPQNQTTAKTAEKGQETIKSLTRAQQNMQAHRARMQRGGNGRLHEVLARGGIKAAPQETPPKTPPTKEAKPLTKAQQNMQAYRAKLKQTGGSGRLHETLGGMAKKSTGDRSEVSQGPAGGVSEKMETVFERQLEPPPPAPAKPEIRGLSQEQIQEHQEAIDSTVKQLEGSPGHAIPLTLGGQHFLAYSKTTGETQVVKFAAWSGRTEASVEKFEGFVAKGAMGMVQKAMKSGTDGLKALKTPIGVDAERMEISNADVKNEYTVLTALNQAHPDGQVPGFQKSPRLVKFASPEGGAPMYGVLTHFYGGGDLSGNAAILTKEQILSGYENVSEGLAFMHSQNMAHLDIKPQNIFVENGQFFLGDFGGVQGDFKTSLNFAGGSPAFTSSLDYRAMGQLQNKYRSAGTDEEREAVIAQRNELAAKMDIFALGLSLYSSIVGKDAQGMEAIPFARTPVVQGTGGFCQLNTDARISMGPRGKNLAVLKEGCSPEMQALLEANAKKQMFSIDGEQYQRIIAEKQASLGDKGVEAFNKLAKAPSAVTAEGQQGFAKIAQEYGPEVGDLVQKMLSTDPSKRPSAAECQEVLGKRSIKPET